MNDDRSSETWTPPDMFVLESMIREKIKKIAENIQGNALHDRMVAEEDAWWATTRRLLPSRKLMAMYYENFRIANVEVRSMYMLDFHTLTMTTLAIRTQVSFGKRSSVGPPIWLAS